MNTNPSLHRDFRVWILGSLILALAFSFWWSSRYPSLDAKSSMSGVVELQDSLSFEAIFTVDADAGAVAEVLATFGNWVYINWQGMAFGLALATLLQSLLPLVRNKLSQSRFGSTMLGSLIGIPLGLCVNCSAPMAYSIYKGGGRVETALAAMLSSPALNVVVIGMSVALLPTYLWMVKLVASLILVFALVPLICAYLRPELLRPELLSPDSFNTHPEGTGVPEQQGSHTAENGGDETLSLGGAIRWLAMELSRSFISLLVKMLPLMALAGLIGAVLVTLFPWDSILGLLPGRGYLIMVTAMLALGLFALILPLPIAFDVVLVATLLSTGLAEKYAGVLLFGLGSFSVYSYAVMRKAGLGKIANAVALAVWGLSFGCGAVSHFWGEFNERAAHRDWVRSLSQYEPHQHPQISGEIVAFDQWQKPAPLKSIEFGGDSQIKQFPLYVSQTEPQPWRMKSVDLGLPPDTPSLFSTNLLPYSVFFSIASADLNQDGWLDLITGSYNGIRVYFNTGGQFQLVRSEALAELTKVSQVALADLNNDQYPDLIFSQFRQGNFVAYNGPEGFDNPQKLPSDGSQFSVALAISDFNLDGMPDLMFGNSSMAEIVNQMHPESANSLYLQTGDGWRIVDSPDEPGATLSLLVSDIDNNEHPDIFVGNDFDGGDRYFEFDSSHSSFNPWPLDRLEEVTQTTMSIDSGDIDNDLKLESYHVQVALEPPSSDGNIERTSVFSTAYAFALFRPINPFGDIENRFADGCVDSEDNCRAKTFRTAYSKGWTRYDFEQCKTLLDSPLMDSVMADSGDDIWHCAALVYYEQNMRISTFNDIPLDCSPFGAGFADIRDICELTRANLESGRPQDGTYEGMTPTYPMNSFENLLLQSDESGNYVNRAKALGVNYAGWGWNGKFADLDGDQWQDILVANGWYNTRSDTSNVFFRNLAGEKFDIQTRKAGLIDFSPTYAYSFLDIDNDADLDLVTFSAYGELKSYLNLNSNNHLQVELRDSVGNRFGIGAKIVIRYGEFGQQLRELKASGGFQSRDPLIAHFGLGDESLVKEIQVTTLDGREYVFSAEFAAGNRFRLHLD